MWALYRTMLLLAAISYLTVSPGCCGNPFTGLRRYASSLAIRLGRRQSQPVSVDFDAESYGSSSGGDRPRTVLSSIDGEELRRLLRRQHAHCNTTIKKRRINNRNEICLFKALRRCGNRLISKIASSPDFDTRCTTREEFLDCMSWMQLGGCRVKHARRGPSRALVDQYQQRLRRLLHSTRGCVIGIDLSAQSSN